MPDLEAAPAEVIGFLDEIRVSRRLAANTVLAYQRDLARLCAFAKQMNRALAALDRSDLEAFVRELMVSGLSPRSVARHVASVRGFYRFLVLDGHLTASPADDVQAPRAWPALPSGPGRRCPGSCRWTRSTDCSTSPTRRRRGGSVIAPSWSCSMRPACGSASS